MATVERRPESHAAPASRSSSAVVDGRQGLRTLDEALEHVHAICFKTGPPRRVGVELEWTVHHTGDPARPLVAGQLRAALGGHAPKTLDPDSPHLPLPHGSTITLEPGGQVELSTPPHGSLARLHAATTADLDYLTDRLARHGLVLGEHGIDPYRPSRRLLRTPRYDAMAVAFARRGVAGLTMMCGTAATQVCLDAGEPGQVAARWRTLHAVGPVLLALFANSSRHAGKETGWASARTRAWLGMDPARTRPVPAGGDPVPAWGRYALGAPLLCVRRPDGAWHPPPGVSFAAWVGGALRPAPTVDDLDYHLSTLFPPVRPRGYVEARFLDAQPVSGWFAPVAVLAGLLATEATAAAARERAAPATGQHGSRAWQVAARRGLADPLLRNAAAGLTEVAIRGLAGTDLPAPIQDQVAETVCQRLARSE